MLALLKNGMVALTDASTGQRIERWPVDARELLAGGVFTAAPDEGEILAPAALLISDTIDKPAKAMPPAAVVAAPLARGKK